MSRIDPYRLMMFRDMAGEDFDPKIHDCICECHDGAARSCSLCTPCKRPPASRYYVVTATYPAQTPPKAVSVMYQEVSEYD